MNKHKHSPPPRFRLHFRHSADQCLTLGSKRRFRRSRASVRFAPWRERPAAHDHRGGRAVRPRGRCRPRQPGPHPLPAAGTPARSTGILLEYALLLIAAAGSIASSAAAVYLFVIGQAGRIAPPHAGQLAHARGPDLLRTTVAALIVLLSPASDTRGAATTRSIRWSARPEGASTAARRAVPFDWAPVVVSSAHACRPRSPPGFCSGRARRAARPPVAAALALALDATLDDLRADPDPRRAVIAAYARMERALARSGLPRSPAEAPREYLRRTLPGVGAGAASVARLTALFERAKFSPHASTPR